jgi:hypothetical protein
MADATKKRDLPPPSPKGERSFQLLKLPPFEFETSDGRRRVEVTRDQVSKGCRLWYAAADAPAGSGYLLFEGNADIDLEKKATSVRFEAYVGSMRLRLFEILAAHGLAAPVP